jgi:hypothetical protein
MSTDEEMAVIGRLVVERKDLTQRNAVLHAEIYRIANGLEKLGKKLTGGNSMFAAHHLTPDEGALLDAAKLGELLSEKAAIAKRVEEISETLKQAGLSG